MENQLRTPSLVALGFLASLFAASQAMADSVQLSATGSNTLSAGVSIASSGALSIVHATLAVPATIAEELAAGIMPKQNEKNCVQPCGKGFPIADEIISFTAQGSNDD